MSLVTFDQVLQFFASHVDDADAIAFAMGEMTGGSAGLCLICQYCEEDRYYPNDEESTVALASLDAARDELWATWADVQRDACFALTGVRAAPPPAATPA